MNSLKNKKLDACFVVSEARQHPLKALKINENDIEFSKQKERYEMEWELEYLNKKTKEKIKNVDKIVRHELDEEHNSDIDSVELNKDDKSINQFINAFKGFYNRNPTKEEVEENLEISINEERLNNEIINNEIMNQDNIDNIDNINNV